MQKIKYNERYEKFEKYIIETSKQYLDIHKNEESWSDFPEPIKEKISNFKIEFISILVYENNISFGLELNFHDIFTVNLYYRLYRDSVTVNTTESYFSCHENIVEDVLKILEGKDYMNLDEDTKNKLISIHS